MEPCLIVYFIGDNDCLPSEVLEKIQDILPIHKIWCLKDSCNKEFYEILYLPLESSCCLMSKQPQKLPMFMEAYINV